MIESHRLRHRRQVLVWIESSYSSNVSDICYLDESILLTKTADILVLVERLRHLIRVITTEVIIVMVIVTLSVVIAILRSLRVLKFFRHRGKSYSFGQIWEWVDQSSLFYRLMIEGAAFSKLAISVFLPELAWSGLVVRVHGTKSCFAKVLWESIVWLSQVFVSVSELAILGEWTFSSLFHKMFAELSLVLLFKSIELPLVSVEVVVVRLLGKLFHNLTGRIVKVSWSTI